MIIKRELRPLYAYQDKGVNFHADDCVGIPIFMEMRLGKSIVAIRKIKRHPTPITSVLLLAPSNSMEAWESELDMEYESRIRAYKMSRHDRLNACATAINSPGRYYCLLNYESFIRSPEIAEFDWGAVIADESTKLKNFFSKTATYCMKGFRNCKLRIALAGNSAPDGIDNLLPQFCFTDGDFMGCTNFWQWRHRFYVRGMFGEWEEKPGARAEIKQALHQRAYIVRRNQVNVGSVKHWSEEYVDMNDYQSRIYKTTKDEYEAVMNDGGSLQTMWAVTREMWLQRIAGGFSPDGTEMISTAKADLLVHWLYNDLKEDSIVLWCRFKCEAYGVRDYLKHHGISAEAMTGNADLVKVRFPMIRRFKSKSTQVLILTPDLGKYSHDFSVASMGIFYSNNWSPDARSQCEDRLIHPMKRDPITNVDLLTRNTVDKEIRDHVMGLNINSRLLLTKHPKLQEELMCA